MRRNILLRSIVSIVAVVLVITAPIIEVADAV